VSCPDDVTLERVLLGFASDDERSHPASCEACRQRLADMEAQGQDFRRFVFPRTLDAVVTAYAGVRRRMWLGWSLSAAAATVVVFLLWPASPTDDYVGVKGGALGLAVYTVDLAGAPVLLEDGAKVAPGAALRFRVSPSHPCHLWLLSIDGKGTVSRLFPPTGESALIATETTLPGGATLDGVVGPERLLAVCTSEPTAYDAVAAAAQRAMVPRVMEQARVPIEGLQGSVLLEKAQ